MIPTVAPVRRLHPNSVAWHEGHTSYHVTADPSVIPQPHIGLRKDVTHPHTAAHGKESYESPPADSAPKSAVADFSGGTAVAGNDQAGHAGTSKAYGKFAAPYGTVSPGQPSVLKFYPLEGKHEAATAQVGAHGYQHYYAGGKNAKPDLAHKNYNTKHLMVYDPSAGSGGDFGETTYTDAWRKTHELAHALTYDQLNQKYGEGRRIGALGKQRTAREAMRAVEWEWMAAHKQRDLAAQLGAHIPDEDFHKELNTVMHDAVHRAVTGKFTDPQEEGFRPHPHKVPLETALNMVRQSARDMGLNGDHDLLKKAETAFDEICRDETNSNLRDTTGAKRNTMSQVSRKEFTIGLAKALRDAVGSLEASITESARREAAGSGRLAKNAGCGDMPEMGKDEMVSDVGQNELTPVPQAGCPACSGTNVHEVGDIGGQAHFICGACSMSYSTPRQENAAAGSAVDDPMMAKSLKDCPKCGSMKMSAAGAVDSCGDCGHKSTAAPKAVGGTAQVYDQQTRKSEIAPTGTVEEKKVAGAKLPGTSKALKGDGSGTKTKGPALKKDAMPSHDPGGKAASKTMMGIGPKYPMPKVTLPGMTSAPAPTHPETKATLADLSSLRPGGAHPSVGLAINEAKQMQADKAGGPGMPIGRPQAFLRRPGGDEILAARAALSSNSPAPVAPPTTDADTQADLKAGGVGFLQNLITRFRGVGNQTWTDLTGAGSSTAGATRAMGARMAMGELDMAKALPMKASPSDTANSLSIVANSTGSGDSHRRAADAHMAALASFGTSPHPAAKQHEAAFLAHTKAAASKPPTVAPATMPTMKWEKPWEKKDSTVEEGGNRVSQEARDAKFPSRGATVEEGGNRVSGAAKYADKARMKKAAMGTGKPAMPSAPKAPGTSMGKTSVDDANKDMGTARSIASNPTSGVKPALPSMKGFKSVISNPTSIPRLPGIKAGPAKPAAAPPSAKKP